MLTSVDNHLPVSVTVTAAFKEKESNVCLEV